MPRNTGPFPDLAAYRYTFNTDFFSQALLQTKSRPYHFCFLCFVYVSVFTLLPGE